MHLLLVENDLGLGTSLQQALRGAGLGLAIVREAARSLGGNAQVRPGPDGRGCSVFVELR